MLSALLLAAAVAAPPGSDSGASCVTLDDRPCYSDKAPAPSPGAQIPAAQLELAKRYARDQVAKGNCAGARASASALADQALAAEIRRACGDAPQPAAGPAVKLW